MNNFQIAEKTSKFKVDTESSNRNKNMPTSNRKVSREKRPSMISELCTTGSGTRMRGSHGNIHSYNNRSNFGANRAVSLDQYSTHNRRSSDGLQQVTSDNNVYYNHQPHRSVDGEVPATITESIQLNKSANDDLSSGGDIRSDPLNRNPKPSDEKAKANQQQQQQVNQYQQQHKYKILNSASSAANNGTKSFMSRLRQFSSRFSFTFDRDAKRNNSTNPNITRNNNANESVLPISKASFCCANKTSSPLHMQTKHGDSIHAMPGNDLSVRHRTHSLDIQVRGRQYSSSNSENSRKSSRNDEPSHIMLMMEDNSNHTTTIGDNKSDADESFSAVCIGGDTGDPGNSI